MPRPLSQDIDPARESAKVRRLFDLLMVLEKIGEATASELERRIQEDVGSQWCTRTLNRDLRLLRGMGFIASREKLPRRQGTTYLHRATVKIVYLE
jgi:predicted DNA-binding transcriptional regulator YafY